MAGIIASEKDNNVLILSKTPSLICCSTVTGGGIILCNATAYMLGLPVYQIVYQVSFLLSIILFAIPLLEGSESCIVDKTKGILYLCQTSPLESALSVQKKNSTNNNWRIEDILDIQVKLQPSKSHQPTIVMVTRMGFETCLLTSAGRTKKELLPVVQRLKTFLQLDRVEVVSNIGYFVTHDEYSDVTDSSDVNSETEDTQENSVNLSCRKVIKKVTKHR